ncbi:MAG: thioredoxin-disulfide reductase [Dehalococcoidales bacterium]|jgi:thioredoxin reductase (NADPH)|nr:thioredoxin-disulfide reductase [Dehalococcoidales bacterium]MDD3264344.1 thioredoxin-disulfide reductase [Dehalococcoidales bacterium]MDD4322110.1 thioredoxin-disulfide reductase [Dehalococcoidales bacterium]MDD4793680.1 thioredoxin-disulfide reductase [Dehalococcoidales bacterium]MDD5121782.1 thioredoxin-disulfide reductase [Dehalococcoidales bacterium]
MKKEYDVAIIGGGPAGLTAGIYSARDRFSTLIIERAMIGGNITTTDDVENYPGFPEGITGFDLTAKMHDQATKHGAETVNANVNAIEIAGSQKIIRTSEGDFSARALIIATGTERVKLNVPGEKELSGRGVSYCATCDGPFFKNKTVAVVGGGNAALYEAIHLAKFAVKVYLIHRRDAYRATMAVVEKIEKNPKIEPVLSSVVNSINGDSRVGSIEIKNVKDNSISVLEVDGIFIAVGLSPNTEFLKGLVEMDTRGSIKVNEKLETSVPGIFAAGDVRVNSIRQVVTAAGDGAHAAFHIREYLES